MKRITGITVAVIIIAFLAYPKVRDSFSDDGSENSRDRGEQVLTVDVYVADTRPIENVIYTTGTLRANETVELSSEASGKIEEIYLREGKQVQKGELLIKINDSELQAQLTRAKFRLNLAEEREKRQAQLLRTGGISQEDYDATLNEVNVLRSDVHLIEAQIDKTEIRAPFEGVLGLKYVSDGSYITPSAQISTLQDLDPIKIDFSVPERYAPLIEVGRPLSFTVEGSDKTLTAQVYAREPGIDTETRTLQVRAVSPNRNRALLPGSFAEIELTLNTIENAIMVPSISLVPELQGEKVFILRDGKIQPQSVQTGIRNERLIQITSGVQAGDTVLTTGLLQARPGMKVNISEIQGD
ncbi:efflux RND transporter periplasmic adaptor subunit [Balneola sp. MJW-20]|uniref:efflux RND transporter periplasmic adaptor subunit n=1 Tax=Gracilimonas aurantiaca TaxID=3234185 RepID=UPI003465BFBC